MSDWETDRQLEIEQLKMLAADLAVYLRLSVVPNKEKERLFAANPPTALHSETD